MKEEGKFTLMKKETTQGTRQYYVKIANNREFCKRTSEKKSLYASGEEDCSLSSKL